MLTEGKCSRIFGFQMVSVWVPGLLPVHVWEYDFPDLLSLCWYQQPSGSDQVVVDVPSSLGVDLYRRCSGRLDRPVQLWFLQSDAYFHDHWISGQYDVQAQNMVQLLPDGYYDADDLQDQGKRKTVKEQPVTALSVDGCSFASLCISPILLVMVCTIAMCCGETPIVEDS